MYINGKAMIEAQTEGIVKYVADGTTGEILGLHMSGLRATDLIVEGALAIRLEATVEEIISTIHAHPTVGESLLEAAHAVYGNAIHIPK
ncbi:Dihydrolipoyl dehydrogenase [bioreactor metagenome]